METLAKFAAQAGLLIGVISKSTEQTVCNALKETGEPNGGDQSGGLWRFSPRMKQIVLLVSAKCFFSPTPFGKDNVPFD